MDCSIPQEGKPHGRRTDGRMDSISSNLAAFSTSLAQLAAAIAISSTARYGGNDDKRPAVG